MVSAPEPPNPNVDTAGRVTAGSATFEPSRVERKGGCHLRAAGVRCYTTGGVPVESDEAPRALFTNPRDTYTQLEFVSAEMATLMRDPRFKSEWSPSWWADRHPLHVQKLSHVTVTTRDVAQAARFYETVLHAPVVHRGDMPSSRSRSVFVLVGEDLMIELAEPLDESSPIARDMDRYHESIYSVTYKVRDLTGAEEYLSGKGVRFAADDGTTLVTDPATSQGAVMGVTTWSIPGDPRLDWTEQP